MSTFRIEAEAMNLTGYRLDSNSFASGGQLISLSGGDPTEIGTASFAFSGSSGVYDVVVGYFDESDGISRLEVRKQGVSIDAWNLNQNLGSSGANTQTLVRRAIATGLSIKPGQKIKILGSEDQGEPARVDYIEFIPVIPAKTNGTNAADILIGDAKNNTINSFGGNDRFYGSAGIADYSQANKGIIAYLNKGIVMAPIYGTLKQPKLMSLGDSITAGEHKVDPTPGAYRTQLWTDFMDDGLRVDFVGSQSNGPDRLGDKDHEGHSGWRINQITGLVNSGLLRTYQPDSVLLMIGTNNVLGRAGVSKISSELSHLIDQITEQSPNTKLLVSSIAPIDPSIYGQKVARKARDFNKLIPDLVSDKVAHGKKVAFVNAGGSLTLEDLVSDGKHPDDQGYNKIGNAWYNAIVERDTLIGIDNITGTAFNDKLVGNERANILEGGAGSDTLTGGAGADTFVYRKTTEGKDTITDFSVNDIFKISASGFGGGLVAGIDLSTTASPTGVFVSSETPTSMGTSANFLYNTNTGILRFDGDGIGPDSALTVATLTRAPSLGVDQFAISA